MNRLPKFCLAALLMVAVTVIVATAANPQDDAKGTITQVYADRQQFVLTDEKGTAETYTMDEDAPVYIDGKEASLEQLKVGTPARVMWRQDEDTRMAIEVRSPR
jgi:hypothetical protein